MNQKLIGKTVFLKNESKSGILVETKETTAVVNIDGHLHELSYDEFVVLGEVQYTKEEK